MLSGTARHPIIEAAETSDISLFMDLVFPDSWRGIRARILETGVEMVDGECPWAPRWSMIPSTIRKGAGDLETACKSVIFRSHDCIHQLWGLAHPGDFSQEDFYYYKRAQMCGEMAVLTLTEFVLCQHFYDTFPELRGLLWSRNALAIKKRHMSLLNTAQIAMRLDELLHKKIRPRWVREDAQAMDFCDDYVPMLERDRDQIDHNWALMKEAGWQPTFAPKARYGAHMSGLELTLWMIRDFEHLLHAHSEPDWALVHFNRERRRRLTLPTGWVS